MKTIVFFSGYHLPHLGGIERYTDNLGKQLIKKGYKVVVVCSNHDNLKDDEIINGVRVLRIPIYNIFKTRYPIPKRNKKYHKIINELHKYDIEAIIVNTRFHLTTLVGAKYGKKNNIPVFLIEHGSQHLTVDNKVLDYFGSIYEHCLTKYVEKFVDYNYGVSLEACKWQEHFHIKSNGVWYNSINEFGKNVQSNKKNNEIIISYAGRILRQKGIIELLEAFKKIKNQNVKLYIAGDGNLLPDLINKNKNDKNIIFTGKLDFDKLTELYAKTDIFVYAPNWPEGLPTSVLEAGFMKCCVIASPYGGTKEIIQNGENGIMITNQNELTEALDHLIKNKSLRSKYSNALYKTIQNKFLWSKTAEGVVRDIHEKIECK